MAEFNERSPRYIVICGATACGKSAAALETASLLGGEIICADSMQIYRGLKVGTAAPTEEETARAPHRLYGFLDPAERYSVARYVADARAAVEECAKRGAAPIVCGGTGLYIDSLCGGVAFEEAAPDDALRAQIVVEYEQKGAQALIDELARADADFAAKIDAANVKRLVRAVELLRSSGVTTAQQTARSRKGGDFGEAKKYILEFSERETLYRRCDERVDAMLARGLLEEAKYVYDNRTRFITAAQAIGYKELFPLFEGEASLGECVEALKRSTRRFAKRQLTWFRRDSKAVRIDPGEKTAREIAEMIAKEWAESL